jgi:peptide/nickel transport system substrate-binding protein
VGITGCSSEKSSPTDAAKKSDATDKSSETAAADATVDALKPSGPFVLGDLIEPFNPPTLEDLEKQVKWIDQPVVDAMAKLREQKKSEPPLVTVEEALAMRNDSAEANEKILSALSMLPPEDGSGVNYDATFNRASLQDLRSTNPVLTNSFAESEIAAITAFGMFSYDWNFIPHASADSVVSWQTSEDRMYDKVVMRKDLTWSDGKPITAHDVVFSFKAIMSSQVPVPAQRTGADEMKWVEAYDEHTLVYFHKKPQATNAWNLNFYTLPKHIYEKSIADDPTLSTSEYHGKFERNPVTGGPYELVSHSRGQEILLRRRESFFMHDGKQVREKPYFKDVRFRVIEDANTRLLALKSGRIDETFLEPQEWQTQTSGDDFYANNTKVYGEGWLLMYIGWNLKTPYFEDVRVRRAMAHAMNYQEMIDDLTYGLNSRAHGIFHPDSWMYPKNSPKLIEFDLDKAEELLEEAGWVDSDGDGTRDKEVNGKIIPFEFTLLVSQKPDRIAICNLLRENLESIGVICHVQPMEAAVFQQRVFEKNFEAEMAGWGTGADPFTNENIFGTGESRNHGEYSNPKVDELFKAGMTEFDRTKRAEIYGEISNLIYEDQPYLFLYNQNWFFGFNKKLRGYRFSPRSPFGYSPGFSSIWSP